MAGYCRENNITPTTDLREELAKILVSMAPRSLSDPTTGKRGESSAYVSNLLGGYSMHMHGYSFNRDYGIVKLQSWGRNNIINLTMLIPLNCHQFNSKLICYPLFSCNRIPLTPQHIITFLFIYTLVVLYSF